MTTAVHQKPATAPAPSKPATTLFQGNLAIDKIDVKEQVRKKFDENAHKELTESVRTKGLINAVTLRPSPKDGKRYELVAGERRYRAAKAAGLKEIPVRVLELDDQAAVLYQVEENIHRKDLTPIEEARGFDLLFKAKKFTVEQLAQLIDKSVPYVYRAVKLLDLPEAILKAIEEGKLTSAHGHQILRVAADRRDELVKYVLTLNWDKQHPTAKQLMERIDNDLSYNLSDAVFPKDKEFAGAIACTGCQYNTGNQGKLFDGAEKGGCTNTPCFDKKTETAWATKVAVLKERFPGVTVSFHQYQVVPHMTIHGAEVKRELTATVKTLESATQSLVIEKIANGKVWIAVKEKQKKAKPAAVAPKGQSEKERAIEASVAEHLEALQSKLVVEATDKQIAAVMDADWKAGWQNNSLKKAGFKTITATNVLRAFWRLEMQNGGSMDQGELLEILGADLKKEKAIATKAAEEAWAKAHPKASAK